MKPKMVGTVMPYIEAVIKTTGGKVLWAGYDAPNPIAKALQSLVAAGHKAESLVIREGFYPGFGKPKQYRAAGHEYLTRCV
jgi:hypothetical protein